jgi:hypothetical protein
MTVYRIKMLECHGVPEGYFGRVPGIGMNREIYCRVRDASDAFTFSAAEAVRFILKAKWPCKCEPPLTVTL